MSVFDHLLNVLDITLKAGDRAAVERQQAATAKKRATKIRGFGDAPKPVDPSCCLAKRELSGDGGGKS